MAPLFSVTRHQKTSLLRQQQREDRSIQHTQNEPNSPCSENAPVAGETTVNAAHSLTNTNSHLTLLTTTAGTTRASAGQPSQSWADCATVPPAFAGRVSVGSSRMGCFTDTTSRWTTPVRLAVAHRPSPRYDPKAHLGAFPVTSRSCTEAMSNASPVNVAVATPSPGGAPMASRTLTPPHHSSSTTRMSGRMQSHYTKQVEKMRARPLTDKEETAVRERNLFTRELKDCTFRPNTHWVGPLRRPTVGVRDGGSTSTSTKLHPTTASSKRSMITMEPSPVHTKKSLHRRSARHAATATAPRTQHIRFGSNTHNHKEHHLDESTSLASAPTGPPIPTVVSVYRTSQRRSMARAQSIVVVVAPTTPQPSRVATTVVDATARPSMGTNPSCSSSSSNKSNNDSSGCRAGATFLSAAVHNSNSTTDVTTSNNTTTHQEEECSTSSSRMDWIKEARTRPVVDHGSPDDERDRQHSGAGAQSAPRRAPESGSI